MEVNATLGAEITALLMPERATGFAPGACRCAADPDSLAEDASAFASLLVQAEPTAPATVALPVGGNLLPLRVLPEYPVPLAPPAGDSRVPMPPASLPPPLSAIGEGEPLVATPQAEGVAAEPVAEELEGFDSMLALRRRTGDSAAPVVSSTPLDSDSMTPPVPLVATRAGAGASIPIDAGDRVAVATPTPVDATASDDAGAADSSRHRGGQLPARSGAGWHPDLLRLEGSDPTALASRPSFATTDTVAAAGALAARELVRGDPQGRAAEGAIGPVSAAPVAVEVSSSQALDSARVALELPARAAAQLPDALAERVHWLIDQNLGSARLKLNPPHLGALDIRISVGDDGTFVQFTSSHSAAREALEAALPRLRELLGAAGLELSGATVGGEQASHRQSPVPIALAAEAGEVAVPEPLAAPVASSRRQIDLYA